MTTEFYVIGGAILLHDLIASAVATIRKELWRRFRSFIAALWRVYRNTDRNQIHALIEQRRLTLLFDQLVVVLLISLGIANLFV